MEYMLPSEKSTPIVIRSDSAPAHRQKRPSRLVLSPPSNILNSELNIQLTPPDEPDVPGKMMGPGQLTIEEDPDSRQKEPGNHVKMGNQYSCPRTPLRSARSSSGQTPTIKGWRHSGTETDSSIHASSIPDFINTDFGHSADEINSILSLSFPRSPNSDRNGQSGSFSTPTTLSPESCPSEAGSMYSYDSYEGRRGKVLEASPASETAILAPSPMIASPSCAHSNFSIYPGEDVESPAIRQSYDCSLKPISAPHSLRNNRSRTASVAVTPSLVTEPSKTIQARRSFGQLLLFRRPSQIREGACACAQSCALHARDEETEELQTSADSDLSLASTNLYLGDHLGGRNPLNGFKPPDNINSWNQFAKDNGQPASDTLARSSLSASLPKPRETFSTQHPSQTTGSGAISNRPRGLLKLVKSQSSLRETFFGPKRNERSLSVQFDQPASNNSYFSQELSSTTKMASPSSNQFSSSDTRNSEHGSRNSFSTFQLVNLIQTDPKIEAPSEGKDSHHSKPGNIRRSGSLNIFKFWKKKKNADPVKPNSRKAEPVEQNSKKKDSKKSGRPSLRIEQISSPISFQSQDPGNHNLRLDTRPLLLSPKFKDNDPKFSYFAPSSEKQIPLGSLPEPDASINPPSSSSVGNDPRYFGEVLPQATSSNLRNSNRLSRLQILRNLHDPQGEDP
ncbi:hypothetical protein PtB15_2B914 [Puccinia triticina]|nr:hypothetical protein PtB15_2B914 [Puccinia triticina]